MKNKLELYFKAARSAKIGIWEVNLKTNLVYWDSVTKSILEVADDYIPSLDNGVNFYSEGESRDKIKMLIQNAIDFGNSFDEKFKIITGNNTVKYVECICQVEFIDGKPLLLLGTFQDITKEQNLINDLQLSVEKFSSIFSSAHDAIFIIDSSNGIITDYNTRSSELTGYNRTELIGVHNSELFPDKYKKQFEVIFENHLAKDNYFVSDSYIQTKCETIIPVEIAPGKIFKVKDQTFLVCFIRDITERKNVEEKMNMLSLAASETTDTLVVANSKGKALWVNNAYLKLTGYSIEELLGGGPGHLTRGEDTDERVLNKLKKAIQKEQSIKVTILNYNKQKEKYWFELNMNPVFDNEGVCINYVGVGRDVTSRKEKEFELQRLLEMTSNQNNKLFNFSHIVSHNIRSHASNLSMVVDIMENTEDVEEKLSYFELFKEGTEKLSETIEYLNEIITYQENPSVEKKKVLLKNEIEKTKFALSLAIKESQITIVHTIPEDLTVCVIPAYLDSILLNLFTNAIKYKSPDRKAMLEIDYEIIETQTIIIFKDNGLGIDLNKNRHKIFGMYKTFHGNEDAKGIGLFITKNQIEAMEGKIEVESEVGKGSVFKIYLNEK